MAKVKVNAAGAAAPVGPQYGISAETYVTIACAFPGFVIRGVEGAKGAAQSGQPPTQPQWLAWLDYLTHLGVPTKFMRFSGEATVPCEWPEDFDATCAASNRTARIFVRPKSIDFDRKATVENVSKRFLAWGDKPRRKDHPPKTEQWLREYGSQPLSASDELRAKIAERF